jgi:hypothetical protein
MRRLTAISCLAVLGAALLEASPAAAQLLNGAPAWSYINTVPATGAATLQIAGANFQNTYNTLFISCVGLLDSDGGGIGAFVGEGSGPTWEGDATNGNGTLDYASTQDGKANGAGDLFDGDNPASATLPTSMSFYIHNPGSSTLHKVVFIYQYGAAGQLAAQAWWGADTNPLTGFELADNNGGTITAGKCSIYGMY